jgi:hypothetical protein
MASSPLGPDRIIICYKDASADPLSASKPSEATVQWATAPVNQPQGTLLGEGYNGIPIKPAPLIVAPGAKPYLTGTGLAPGSSLPGLVYGEIDSVLPNVAHPQNVTILASSPVQTKLGTPHTSDATIYTAPSGAMVFDSGTFDWYSGLGVAWVVTPGATVTNAPPAEEDGTPVVIPVTSRVQQFTVNILNTMIAASSAS